MDFMVQFVDILCTLLILAIFVRAILSWFAVGPGNPLVAILYQITEPILDPLRRIIPRIGMIDISPMVAIILLVVLRELLVYALTL